MWNRMTAPITPRKLAIIPVYRERGKIGKVLEKFEKSVVDEICIVLDCPSEAIMREIMGAAERIETPVKLIKNTVRRGIGYAIRKGIDYALANRYDLVVVMAGNNKDDPRQIHRLLRPICEGGYDYVQGSRFLRGGKRKRTPILRGIFSRVFPFIWTLLTHVRCTDVTNGFRAHRIDIFSDKRINLWQDWLDGYALEYYLHYKTLTLGYRVKEVGVSKTYPFRHIGGYSKIVPLRDWWQIVGPLVCLKLNMRR